MAGEPVVAPEEAIDWKSPDYRSIVAARVERLDKIRRTPGMLEGLKAYYADHPYDFISDWGWTFDPRNPEIGLPSSIPFVLFKRQREFIEWLYEGWKDREDGLVEKCRDMGISWLCVAFGVWMFLFREGVTVGYGSRKEEYVDDLSDPKSLFWKARHFIEMLPVEFQPAGWSPKKHALYMAISNPENGSVMVGEAGDNIGRGARTSIYFVDESAHLERPEAIDAALSMTTNCRLDVSTPNGSGNPFYRKRHGGNVAVFIFDWTQDPRKDQAWYDKQKRKLDAVTFAQEVERDYAAAVSNAFFDAALVDAAMKRGPADVIAMGGLRVGLDVARYGKDKCSLTFRRGRLLIKQVKWAKVDLMTTAGIAKAEIEAMREEPEQIAVDTVGLGAGVADALRGWFPDRRMPDGTWKKIVVDVESGARLSDGQHYNVRAFMATEVREWLKGAAIKRDEDLRSQMTSIQYTYRGGALLLESKEDAEKRGVKSPNDYDSLALTFAVPTIPKKQRPRVRDAEPAVPGVM